MLKVIFQSILNDIMNILVTNTSEKRQNSKKTLVEAINSPAVLK